MNTVSSTITIDATDLNSIAQAIAAGITTPALVADFIGLELQNDLLVLEESPMFADDGNCEIEYPHDTEPSDAASQYADEGDWGQDNSTSWVTVHTYRKGVNDRGQIERSDEETHTITLSPAEPECLDGGEHLWHSPYSLLGGLKENPGVWGNGGGIISKEICRCCGCVRTTDTWAQNPENGEQGLTSVEYSAGEYAGEMEKRAIKRAKDDLGTDDEPQEPYDFCWTDDENYLVGCNDDDLRDYGFQLARNPDAPKITGTAVSTVEE